MSLTFVSWQISRAVSLKLQRAIFGVFHIPPLVKSPPQYRLACNCPSLLPLPHGQLTTATPPMLVSGHSIVKFKSGLPECDGIIV